MTDPEIEALVAEARELIETMRDPDETFVVDEAIGVLSALVAALTERRAPEFEQYMTTGDALSPLRAAPAPSAPAESVAKVLDDVRFRRDRHAKDTRDGRCHHPSHLGAPDAPCNSFQFLDAIAATLSAQARELAEVRRKVAWQDELDTWRGESGLDLAVPANATIPVMLRQLTEARAALATANEGLRLYRELRDADRQRHRFPSQGASEFYAQALKAVEKWEASQRAASPGPDATTEIING